MKIYSHNIGAIVLLFAYVMAVSFAIDAIVAYFFPYCGGHWNRRHIIALILCIPIPIILDMDRELTKLKDKRRLRTKKL